MLWLTETSEKRGPWEHVQVVSSGGATAVPCSMLASLPGSLRAWELCALRGRRGGREKRGDALQRTFGLKDFKGWGLQGDLVEDLNRICVSFMLIYLNEIYSLNFTLSWVWMANGTNWISAVPLSSDLRDLLSGWGEV